MDYESARDDYESAVRRVRNSVSNVKSSADSAESYCQDSSGDGSWVSICRGYIALKSKYDQATLLTACESRMQESLCKACLGIK